MKETIFVLGGFVLLLLFLAAEFGVFEAVRGAWRERGKDNDGE